MASKIGDTFTFKIKQIEGIIWKLSSINMEGEYAWLQGPKTPKSNVMLKVPLSEINENNKTQINNYHGKQN